MILCFAFRHRATMAVLVLLVVVISPILGVFVAVLVTSARYALLGS